MIKITQVTPLLKPGYVAQDKSGEIYWYKERPYPKGTTWEPLHPCPCESFKDFDCLQEVEKWADDWKDSLIEIKGNEDD